MEFLKNILVGACVFGTIVLMAVAVMLFGMLLYRHEILGFVLGGLALLWISYFMGKDIREMLRPK